MLYIIFVFLKLKVFVGNILFIKYNLKKRSKIINNIKLFWKIKGIS